MKEFTLTIVTQIDTVDLAEAVVNSVPRDELLNFVMFVDEFNADYSFTEKLIDELQKSLDKERCID